MASVVGLFMKPGGGIPMTQPSENRIELQAGYGILGDANAHRLSPRQVLVTQHEELCRLGIQAGALRENIVVAGLDAPLLAPGTRLDIGSAAIRLTFHCEPCKRISHLVSSLKDILKQRGLLGVVVASGTVGIGDDVTAQAGSYPALPDRPYERFRDFIAQVPAGRVVSYRHVAVGMGVAMSYMRAIPRYVSQTPSGNVHRIVDSEGGLIEGYVPHQAAKLLAEGIDVVAEGNLFAASLRRYVDLQRYGWDDCSLYLG